MQELISIYDTAAVDRLRAELKFEPRRLRALRTAYFKKFLGVEAALAELPAEVRDEFARRVEFHPLAVAEARDSQVDGATKLVLRTAAGYLIESVIMRTGTGRVSLCVSSQVGCAAACGFCATGQMGIAKNLSAAEILDQVVLAGERMQAEGRRVRNIVFMGMGEPFHNEEAVYEAVAALLSPEIVPPPAGPHSHFHGRHSGRDGPLRAAVSGSEPRAQLAQRAAGRARAADSAGRQVFARRAAGRRGQGESDPEQHGDDRVSHAGRRERFGGRCPRAGRLAERPGRAREPDSVQPDRVGAAAAHDRAAAARCVRRDPARGRLHHDDPLFARRRHRGRLRPARAAARTGRSPAAGATSHAPVAYMRYARMDDIIAGVRTFQRDVYPQYRELFEKLAAGQSPEALVITCSDSRVDPFLFTQAQPGQLFVLRNAGNLVPKYDGLVGGVTATIEFAVVGLRRAEHHRLRALRLRRDSRPAAPGRRLTNMPHVADWLSHHAEPVREILANAGRLGGPDEMAQAVDANVLVQLENLRAHPCVAEALAAGRVKLHGWVYDIASGRLFAQYDEQWQQFGPL